MTRTASGGPATIGGIRYQLLWCLLRLSRFEVGDVEKDEDGALTKAVLVLEPSGGGGDAREDSSQETIVTQLKSRSGGGSWSLQEVIKDVFPDLLKAVNLNANDITYQFVTEGHRGNWKEAEDFFESLKSKDPGSDPISQLTSTKELHVGARIRKDNEKAKAFWEKPKYKEKDLFSKIVDVLADPKRKETRQELEQRVWHLLAHFKFKGGLSDDKVVAEVDANLRQVIDCEEDVRAKRNTLLMDLAELAQSGNVQITLGEFFQQCGIDALPSDRVSTLLVRAERELEERLTVRGYSPLCHVQDAFTEKLVELLMEAPVLVITGGTGAGKSWHCYALASALASRGELVAHVEAAESARQTLDEACGILWNTVKRHSAIIPFSRITARLPGPPPSRVLVIDGVEDATIANRLAFTQCEALGIKLVLSCALEVSDEVVQTLGNRCRRAEVPSFSPSELNSYLQSRELDRWEGIPGDVREILSHPLMARLYCDTRGEAEWRPTNEYELFQGYWRSKLAENPSLDKTLDLGLLCELGRSVLAGEPYPWRADFVYGIVRHEASLDRLRRSGWLVTHSNGSCSLWHDRILNWLLAVTLVEDILGKAKTADEAAALCSGCARGELRASGRSLAYVPMDTLWLLSAHPGTAGTSSAILAAFEQCHPSGTLYSQLVPTLGGRAVAGLLARLDSALSGSEVYRAGEVASCLAELDATEASAKARQLLDSERIEWQSVALDILRLRGTPSSLDRLWSLHLSQEQDRALDYQRLMGALTAALRVDPSWLERRLAGSDKDTPKLTDLIYLLARLGQEGKAIWRRQKAHLKRVVPGERRRCLVRCIYDFQDKEELEFVQAETKRDEDFVGDMAIATLSRLAPEIAIQELADCDLKYLVFSRGWHLHPLLVARPEETKSALRSLLMSKDSGWRWTILYSGAENEIDEEETDYLLDQFERALELELEDTPGANAGPLHDPLTFIHRVIRIDLLARLQARRGGKLPELLKQYLGAIGPRPSVHGRLNDSLAFQALEMIGSPALQEIVKEWMIASSWYGRMDGLRHAHKYSNAETRAILRQKALSSPESDNEAFEGYEATNALCHLRDWESLLEIILQHGLSVSPYVLECRRGQEALPSSTTESLLRRLEAGESSSELLLAAGFARDSRLCGPVRETLLRETDRDTFLAAAIAADLLEVDDQDVVLAMQRRLDDPSLKERVVELLFSIGTDAALEVLVGHLEANFDCRLCHGLGRYENMASRAANIAWANRHQAARSRGFALVLPLIARAEASGVLQYLERFAFGVERSPLGDSVRGAAIRGFGSLEPERGFEAARGCLSDKLESEREKIPILLVTLDARRGVKHLLECIRHEDDETVQLAIADAMSGQNIDDELTVLLDSDDALARRAACVLGARRNLSDVLVQSFRDSALDADVRVSTAAIQTVREHLRAVAVRELIEAIVEEPPGARRFVMIELAARASSASKDRPEIRSDLLSELVSQLTPLELVSLRNELKKGARKFQNEARRRERKRASSVGTE